ncbi:MAG TPA: DUF3253 domain-containing protein [Brevundimonas sp.]|uniref:DUF3253 domain-containing protein n=1 Tax=Brevundimonas sp. TaxID=1871086 RepID=UPI002B62E37F|nr:DUF3253 domain-containing protein [Brevundimonas sp.]HRH19670.1 DUF3253 domain-containing protein [Brevundimonas sp.]
MSDPIQDAILARLAKVDPQGLGKASIEPAEVAKALQPEQWQRVLPKVKTTALGMMRRGQLIITKKGKAIDPGRMKGVIRLRLPTTEERAAMPAMPDDAGDDLD